MEDVVVKIHVVEISYNCARCYIHSCCRYSW